MCGRYATTRSAVDLAALFDAQDETDDGLAPDYNVAPTDSVPVVRVSKSADARVISLVSWGLVPSYAKDTKGAARMINARAETVATSGAFKSSFAKRRCLVPADGWYEWVKLGPKEKQAYFMTPRDGGVVVFAGLWSVWGDAERKLLTCSVVTTGARGDLATVHDRMPLTLSPDKWDTWLDGDADPDLLLAPPTDEYLSGFEIRPVGSAVGDVRNDGPSLVTRIPGIGTPVKPDGRVDLTLF
ncbi:SOS response-associated peptidase [Virgisporangium aliadipatigenens]|nr:SOS response-associated peptidase [Virgisporangium aliadipatigenens]